MKTRTSFGYSAAALVTILLHVSTSIADTSDIIRSPAAVTCDCCYVSINSDCCLECLARVTEVGGLAPLAELLTREAEFGHELGTSSSSSSYFREGGVREPAGWLPGCRCCYREKLLRPRNRYTIIGASCCAFCLKSKSAILKLQLANAAGNSAVPRDGYSVGGVGAATNVDESVSGGGGGEGEGEVMVVGPSHVQKRMSMDCMCCSNSGIADCCSKCRLMA